MNTYNTVMHCPEEAAVVELMTDEDVEVMNKTLPDGSVVPYQRYEGAFVSSVNMEDQSYTPEFAYKPVVNKGFLPIALRVTSVPIHKRTLLQTSPSTNSTFHKLPIQKLHLPQTPPSTNSTFYKRPHPQTPHPKTPPSTNVPRPQRNQARTSSEAEMPGFYDKKKPQRSVRASNIISEFYSAKITTLFFNTSTTPPFTEKVSSPVAEVTLMSPGLSAEMSGAWLSRIPNEPPIPGSFTAEASPLKMFLSGEIISNCITA
jgi:hypothetical protein